MEKALAIAYRFLSFRPRSVVETEKYLRKNMQKYSLTQGSIDAALELLKDQGNLNDGAFIKSFVASRSALKPKGKKMLTMELKNAGIAQSDIDTYFSENSPDESELAQKALQKKMKSLLSITDEKKRYAKAISFLLRRGFLYDTARQAYLQLIEK